MRKYFYSDGTDKFGPVGLEELKTKNISRDTLIWYEGLGDWKPAGELPELEILFTSSPPPVRSASAPSYTKEAAPNQKPPKTWLVESILVTLFCCLPFGIAGIVNAAKVESRFYAGDVSGAVRSSKEAGKWTMISFWIGISGVVLYALVLFIGILSDF